MRETALPRAAIARSQERERALEDGRRDGRDRWVEGRDARGREVAGELLHAGLVGCWAAVVGEVGKVKAKGAVRRQLEEAWGDDGVGEVECLLEGVCWR